MGIFLVGISHRTAPIELREQLAIGEDRLHDALEALMGGNTVREGLIVSTCNRVEIIAAGDSGDGAAHLFNFLERYHGYQQGILEKHSYTFTDLEAVRHVFRVTSSLDSMVVGEPQITGQVKEAFQVAQNARAVGHQLNRLMSRAFAVAKRVRNETGIGSSAVSVSFVAVELARRVFDTLRGATVLLLGAGEMAELAARHLKGYGVARLLIANRTFEKAQSLADDLQGEAIDFDHFEKRLAEADVVLCSTGADHHLIQVEQVRHALNARRNRPVLLIDISVPRNVDPAISALDNAFVFDVDDLENVVSSNLKVRQQEAQRAEAIVEAEAERFIAFLAEGDINEIIGSFRQEVSSMVQAELEKSRKRLGSLSPEQEDALRILLASVVNRLTLPVIKQLRESDEGQSAYLELWRQLSQRDSK
jgi:glutamyl-tRNA reductase